MADEGEQSTDESTRARRVLLVEDDAELSSSVAGALCEEGYDVVTAPNGQRALDLLAAQRAPDVILLDLMMPVMDGWEFRARLKDDPSLADIPVVAITADPTPRAAAIHAESVLRKPFTLGDLLVAVERVLLARDRRLMMERLEQTERLAALGTIAAGVAHEIGNPLSYTVANLALAEEHLPELREAAAFLREGFLREGAHAAASAARAAALEGRLEDLGGCLQQGRAGVERVRLIVRNLQSLSRRAEERRGPVRVEAVLESAIAMAWNQISYRARFAKEITSLPTVDANEAQLVQLFVNLLVNAAHAIRGARETNEIAVRARDEAGAAVVEIRDTGAGMSPAVQERIFEPFFTTKGAGEGTGLGLWICREVVAAHGGELTVESRLGEGSVFRVRLPGVAGVQPAVGTAPAPGPLVPPPSGGRAQIWIVDDEPIVATTLARVLRATYDTVVFTAGEDVLEQLRVGGRFDVLLCDLMMPEMTGMELLREMERNHPHLADRMIFLTGGAFTPESQAFLEAHSRRCLEKPFEISVLKEKIERCRRGELGPGDDAGTGGMERDVV